MRKWVWRFMIFWGINCRRKMKMHVKIDSIVNFEYWLEIIFMDLKILTPLKAKRILNEKNYDKFYV